MRILSRRTYVRQAAIGNNSEEDARNILLNAGIDSLRACAGFVPDTMHDEQVPMSTSVFDDTNVINAGLIWAFLAQGNWNCSIGLLRTIQHQLLAYDKALKFCTTMPEIAKEPDFDLLFTFTVWLYFVYRHKKRAKAVNDTHITWLMRDSGFDELVNEFNYHNWIFYDKIVPTEVRAQYWHTIIAWLKRWEII